MLRGSSPIEGPVQGLVPLNSQEIDELRRNFTHDCLPYFKALRDQHQITLQADKKLVVLDREIEESAKRIDERAKRIDVLDKKEQRADEVIANCDKEIAVNQKRLEEAESKLKELSIKEKYFLTKAFYATFYGKKPLPTELVDSIFSKYLADKVLSLSREENCPKINSMAPFVRYIEDHKGKFKVLNFKHYKSQINDIKTLADYLTQSSCTIKTIAFVRSVSDPVKLTLEEAIQAKPALEVKYF